MEINDLLRCRGWTRWPLRVLLNLNYLLTLTCEAEGHLSASLHGCSMHMQPPHSLGIDHTASEPLPSLRLQRWTSSAVALLRCKLPISLKCSALWVSLLAAVSVPQLLPQEACGCWAMPRHHQTSCNAQCIQPSLSPKHEQRPEMSTQHHCATGCSIPPPAAELQQPVGISISCASSTQKPLLLPDQRCSGLVVLVAIWNSLEE